MSYRYFQTRVIWGGASELFGLIGAKPELVEGGRGWWKRRERSAEDLLHIFKDDREIGGWSMIGYFQI